MDERLRFVARLLEGEKMAVLCREFDISRKTGYKIFQRYRDCGLEGLTDRSRRPYRQANKLPQQIETRIVQLKKERPSWGAPRIRERLRRLYEGISPPAIGTVHAVLDRHGLVSRGRCNPTTCGVRTIRASSCPPTGATAIRSPTATSPAATYCAAKPCPAPRRPTPSWCSGGRGVRPAQGDPHRQRRALRQRTRPVRPEQAVGLVAAARHPDRAHQARSPRTERSP